MKGYWGDEAKTRDAVDEEGWMHTGDLRHGRAGLLNIVGGLKDMVIRGGENVYPREIEEFLYRTPRCRTCRWWACRTRYGEEPCAWIKLRAGQTATADEIREPAGARSPTTRCRATSGLSMSFR